MKQGTYLVIVKRVTNINAIAGCNRINVLL